MGVDCGFSRRSGEFRVVFVGISYFLLFFELILFFLVLFLTCFGVSFGFNCVLVGHHGEKE